MDSGVRMGLRDAHVTTTRTFGNLIMECNDVCFACRRGVNMRDANEASRALMERLEYHTNNRGSSDPDRWICSSVSDRLNTLSSRFGTWTSQMQGDELRPSNSFVMKTFRSLQYSSKMPFNIVGAETGLRDCQCARDIQWISKWSVKVRTCPCLCGVSFMFDFLWLGIWQDCWVAHGQLYLFNKMLELCSGDLAPGFATGQLLVCRDR